MFEKKIIIVNDNSLEVIEKFLKFPTDYHLLCNSRLLPKIKNLIKKVVKRREAKEQV